MWISERFLDRVLNRFVMGQQSHDNTVLTALTVSTDVDPCPMLRHSDISGIERCDPNGTNHEIPFQCPVFLH